MFGGLIRQLDQTCLSPCANGVIDDEDAGRPEDRLAATVPNVLGEVADVESKSRLGSLRALYALTQAEEGGQNRVVKLVCTTKWDVVTAVSSCLTEGGAKSNEEDAEARRLALLVLNNLSIPNENKAVMTLGAASETLLRSLAHVIEKGYPQSYLCVSCLMNLSYLEDAVQPILHFCPNGPNIDSLAKRCQMSLDRPNSLLRTVERMMRTYAPYAKKKVRSVEAEAVRWSMGFVRNIAGTEARANLVSRTEIPRLVVACVRSSPRPTVKWTKDSMEEMALQALCRLARWPEGREVLRSSGAVEAMESVVGVGGIHGFRASLIQCSLLEM